MIPLYITADGTIRYKADFLPAIYRLSLQGKPIRSQLEALGFIDEFDQGTTPWLLPYTIS